MLQRRTKRGNVIKVDRKVYDRSKRAVAPERCLGVERAECVESLEVLAMRT